TRNQSWSPLSLITPVFEPLTAISPGEICVRTIVINPVIAEDVHKSEVRHAYVIVRTGCLKPERVVGDGFRPVNCITGWIGVEIIEICDTAIWRGVSTAGEIADARRRIMEEIRYEIRWRRGGLAGYRE